jgi:hypothetical protein
MFDSMRVGEGKAESIQDLDDDQRCLAILTTYMQCKGRLDILQLTTVPYIAS